MDRHENTALVDRRVQWSALEGNPSVGLRAIWKGYVNDKWLLTVYEKISHSLYCVTGDYNPYMGSSPTCERAKSDAVQRAIELGILEGDKDE